MTQDVVLIIIALILLVLTPIVPKMFRIRVKFLRWLKWNKIADWHERNIAVLTPILRSLLVVIAIVLIGTVVL